MVRVLLLTLYLLVRGLAPSLYLLVRVSSSLACTCWYGLVQYDAPCHVLRFRNSGVSKLIHLFEPFTQGEANTGLDSRRGTTSACKISSAQIQVSSGGRARSRCRRCKQQRTVRICDAVAVAAPSAACPGTCASSSRRSPPPHERLSGRRPPGATVAEPGARRQPGCRGSAGISHRPLFPVQDGGVSAAERASLRERQGPRLAS